MDTFNQPQLVELLRKACLKAGSRKAFATYHGMSPQYLTDVLAHRRDPGEKVLRSLGLEKVVPYRRRTAQ